MIAFKAVKPKIPDTDSLALVFHQEMKGVGKEIEQDYQKATRTWNPPPKFDRVEFGRGWEWVVQITTQDKRVIWTDQGTKPHWIHPKWSRGPNARLFFNKGFSPKSKPGTLGAFGGSSWGPKVVARLVHHPGTKARDFTGQIAKKREPWLWARATETMRRVAKEANRGL